MKYELDKAQIKKARKIIKKLEEQHKMWLIAKASAKKELESAPKKHYQNIKDRIKNADKEMDKIEDKIVNLHEAIKTKQLEI